VVWLAADGTASAGVRAAWSAASASGGLMVKKGLARSTSGHGRRFRIPSPGVYPYLLRDLAIDRPNQVWCADLTYIPMRHGFLYLVAVMDWATRSGRPFGNAAHWQPVPRMYISPLTTSRTSTVRLLPPRLADGINGSINAHSASLASFG
jgi:hypothetical protein